jgi:cyanophycinase
MESDEGDRPGDPGRLLVIGGAEARGSGLLERFVELCGGDRARIVLVTTATGVPEEVHADYEREFRRLGADHTRELRLRGRSDADGDDAAKLLEDATGVFFSGGDQSRLRALVGSRTGEILRDRLHAGQGLVIAGTSAGATAMGRTMILGGEGPGVSAATVRTGPGLGLLPKALIVDMHFSERGRLPRLLSAMALDPEHLGVGIGENTGILVEGTRFEVLGTGVAMVADGQNATVIHGASDDDPITLFGVGLHLLPAGCVFDIATREAAIGPAHDRY